MLRCLRSHRHSHFAAVPPHQPVEPCVFSDYPALDGARRCRHQMNMCCSMSMVPHLPFVHVCCQLCAPERSGYEKKSVQQSHPGHFHRTTFSERTCEERQGRQQSAAGLGWRWTPPSSSRTHSCLELTLDLFICSVLSLPRVLLLRFSILLLFAPTLSTLLKNCVFRKDLIFIII